MNTRFANKDDRDGIRSLYLATFDEAEAATVADLAIAFFDDTASAETFSLVTVNNDEVIAHVSFSPIFAKSSKEQVGYILAPLAVSVNHQKKGLGSAIVKQGLDIIEERGGGIVLVYGDPNYYSRLGFEQEPAKSYIAPYPLQFPEGLQVLTIGRSCEFEAGAFFCVEPLSDASLW